MNLSEFTYKHPNALYFIDFDETLFKTGAKVKVYSKDKCQFIGYIDSTNWHSYSINDNHVLDSSEFHCADLLETTSVPIAETILAVKNLLETDPYHTTVVILSARWGFTNMPKFKSFLRTYGLDRALFHPVGDKEIGISEPIAARKAAYIRSYLDTRQYDHVTFVDDSEKNLIEFSRLPFEYPDIRFTAWRVVNEESHLYLDANGSSPISNNW